MLLEKMRKAGIKPHIKKRKQNLHELITEHPELAQELINEALLKISELTSELHQSERKANAFQTAIFSAVKHPPSYENSLAEVLEFAADDSSIVELIKAVKELS